MKLTNLAMSVAMSAGIFALVGCGGGSGGKSGLPADTVPTPVTSADPTVTASSIVYNDMAVHDPSIIKADDGTFYVFGSHLSVAKSTDLMSWTRVADGPSDANPIFNTVSSQLAESFEWTADHDSWAPDVIKLKDNQYHFYYDICGNGVDGNCNAPRSVIGIATSANIEGPYVNQGIILRTGMTAQEIADGKGPAGITEFDGATMPNGIDPHLYYDKAGKLWMVYGSYFGGIYILEMDEATGAPKAGQGYGTHVAGGGFAPIEGSWIVYSPETDYYYMFNSIGGFDAAGGYNIRVSRSKNPNGPFLDAAGNNMLLAKDNLDTLSRYGVKLMGGFNFVSEQGDSAPGWGYLSPGHNSVYYDAATKKYFLVTHARFPNRGEEHSVRVHEMWLNHDGWFVASPQRYAPISGTNVVDSTDVVGDYRFISHMHDSNTTGHDSVYVTLTADRKITGEVTGYYLLSNTDANRITITITSDTKQNAYVGSYEGVMQWQWDDAAKKLVPTFSALSLDGVSVWGSQLEKKTTQEAVTSILDSISIPSEIRDSVITVPLRGTRAATITWVSSDRAYINLKADKKTGLLTGTGIVHRPSQTAGDQTVKLTATVTLNGVTETREYSTKVIALPPAGLKAEFKFEDNLDDTLGMVTGAKPTGDRIWKTDGATVAYSDGKTGRALSLNGTNGVLLPDGLISNYEYTVSFWINPTVTTGFSPAFFGAVDEKLDVNDIPYSDTWVSFLPQGWNGGTMLWGRVPNWFDGITGLLIPAGQWTHMAFAVNQGVATVYINGEAKFTGGGVDNLFGGKVGRFALGVNYWDLPFNGLIDDLKIYETPLSAEEIKNLDLGSASNAEVLASATNLLSLGNISALKDDIDLPVNGAYSAAISWHSSNTAVIDDYGTVTQPVSGEPDATVILTATVSYGGLSATKDFTAVVKSLTPPTPVASYSFEDDLVDAKGTATGIITGNHADNTGGTITYDAGVKGKAAVFDGNSGVLLADNLVKDNTYSISVWLSPTQLNQFTTSFFAYSDVNHWISLTPKGPTSADTMLWSGSVNWFDGSAGSQVATGTWTHLVFVVDSGKLTTYINGKQTKSYTGYPDVLTAAATHFALGVNFWDTPYNGKMDELKIYDEAITQTDVDSLYAEGNH